MNSSGVSTMLGLVAQLPAQLRASWSATETQRLGDLTACRRMIVCGMGGSAAAAEICAGAFAGPEFEIVVARGYAVGAALRPDDLVVFSSYSGNTEETLACFDDVRRRRPHGPSLVVASGGALAERATAAAIEVLDVPPGLPPRASLGHGVGRLAGVLAAVGVQGVAEAVAASVERLEAGNHRWGLEGVDGRDPFLWELADQLQARLPVLYAGAPTTVAAARRLRAQLNENAKVLALTAEFPELDHNEIVGWSLPSAARAECVVLALRDPHEHPRVRRRFEITREVLGVRVPAWIELEAADGPPLARCMELAQAGDVLSVLLADRTGVDPMPVEPIDVLKQRLAAESTPH